MNNQSDLRMLFFVRTDLGMTKGKIATQVGHAVQYLVYKQIAGVPSELFLQWMNEDSTKICLKVPSFDDLVDLYNITSKSEFPSILVMDKGYTQFDGVCTHTVVGWGPLRKKDHEEVTSHLKLL